MLKHLVLNNDPIYVPPLRRDRNIRGDDPHYHRQKTKPMAVLRKLGVSKARA